MSLEKLSPEIVVAAAGAERTEADEKAIVLQQMLVGILLDWEAGCARQKDRPPVSSELVEMYAEALVAARASAVEVRRMRTAMLATRTFFPAVAEMVAWLRENREARGMEGWVAVLDDRGGTIVVPSDKAHNGRFVAEGGGNGKACGAMADVRDILRDVYDARETLGLERLTEATAEQMESVGMARGMLEIRDVEPLAALPSPSVPNARAEELIELARRTRTQALNARNPQEQGA